jgi:hypothetical protein
MDQAAAFCGRWCRKEVLRWTPKNDGFRLPLAHKRRAVSSCLLLNAVGGSVTGSRLMLGKGME